MSDQPASASPVEEGRNAFTALAQTPRVLLFLLAGWSILTVATESFTNSPFFLENHQGNGEIDLDGALGGLALGWQGVPLAAAYIYSARNPVRHHLIFMLGLIHMGSLSLAQLYHLIITTNFTVESIIIPLAGSATLAALCLGRLMQERGDEQTTMEGRTGN